MIVDNKYQIGILVTDKRIINAVTNKQQYWKRVKYGKKTYILTFDNVYQVK